jgi:hypothetical protein
VSNLLTLMQISNDLQKIAHISISSLIHEVSGFKAITLLVNSSPNWKSKPINQKLILFELNLFKTLINEFSISFHKQSRLNNSIMTKLIEKVSFHIFSCQKQHHSFIISTQKVVNWKSSVMNNQKSTHTIFPIINFSKFSISMNFISALLKVLKWKSFTFFVCAVHEWKIWEGKVQRFMTIRITNRFN